MKFNKIFIALMAIFIIFTIASVSATDMSSDINNNISIDSQSENLIIDNSSNEISDTIISTQDIEMYYKNGTKLEATLLDSDGNILPNQILKFNINGVDYQRTTNSDGVASISINLNPGSYEIAITFDGTSKYAKSSTTAVVNILSVIESSDLVKYYKNESRYYATFLDGQGNPLVNTDVTFNINGVFYTRTTDSKGVASLNINLNPNTYVITSIHPKNGLMSSNAVTILSTIYSDDLVKGYKDNEQYYATFLDGQGNPLVNTDVTFNINGVFYSRTTNASGVARLNINLIPNNYIITAIHPNGQQYSNNVMVMNDLTTYVLISNKMYVETIEDTIDVTLYNELNHVLPNQDISISINQKLYALKTDENGVAKLSIDFDAGNYDGEVIFDGNSFYKGSNTKFNVVVQNLTGVNLTQISGSFYGYKSESEFKILVTDQFGNILDNKTVDFFVDGETHTVYTDSNGIASLKLDLSPNMYTIVYTFSNIGYKKVKGDSDIYVIGTDITSITSKSNVVKKGSKFEVILNAGSTPLPGKTVIFTINGVSYKKTTNDFGVADITINLNAGKYTFAYAFEGDDIFKSSSGSSLVEVIDPIKTTLSIAGSYEFILGKNNYYYVVLKDEYENTLAGKEIVFILDGVESVSKTNAQGVASLKVPNEIGSFSVSFSFNGDNDYGACKNSGTIIVKTESAHVNGFYLFGNDMYNLDLEDAANNGVNTIFLNFYAFSAHGSDAVSEWIEEANSYGIAVHIWVQCLYDGSWISPVNSDGSFRTDIINSKITEITKYIDAGANGIHLDYMRFPGTAYKYTNGAEAITNYVSKITSAIKDINQNIVVSVALMPETTSSKYYYGQDYTELSKIVDMVCPMVYKGNYKSSTSWITTTLKWYVDNSQGAIVCGVIQSYVSDSDTSRLSSKELLTDAQSAANSGATGVIVFRYGISNPIDFDSINYPSDPEQKNGTQFAISDILTAAKSLKSTCENNGTLPSYIMIKGVKVAMPQLLYLMAKTCKMIMDGSSYSDIITLIKVNNPALNNGDEIYSYIDDDEFYTMANAIVSKIESTKQAPNNIESSAGNVKYSSLLYMYCRILAYDLDHGQMPATCYVTNYLDHVSVTVNMMPSSSRTEGYSYINYTTTWLNYCPKCGYYGTFLINPKGVYEGEITCSCCDSDFCGVTGWDKLYNPQYQITRLSESIPTGKSNATSVSMSDLFAAAKVVKTFLEANDELPDSVVIGNSRYTVPVYVYLLCKAIVKINNNDFSDIALIEVDAPSNPTGSVIDSTLTKEQYLDAAQRTATFIENYNQAPNYCSSPLGNIVYNEIVDAFSRIVVYYDNNKALPNTCKIDSNGGTHNPVTTETIDKLAKSLTSGLTTDYAKAQALYNYVRDSISYEFYYNTVKGAEGTLSSGAGNCCDQAQLLVALARSAGLTIRFVHGTCTFSSGTYGHVWTQFYIDGQWVVADPTSTRNSLGVVNNWNTGTATIHNYYTDLPF